MTSLRRIEANRRNAQLSTGPTTEEGKKRSRQNAVRHGLTAETVIDWIIDVPKSRPRVEVMIPFAHESRGGFAAGCVIEVDEKKLVTTVRERSVCAETEPLAAGKALVTLRTDPLTTAHDRSIGLALKV